MLARHSTAPTTAVYRPHAGNRHRGLRIYVVADDRGLRDLLVAALEGQSGYTVASGLEDDTYDRVARLRPDLLVVDLAPHDTAGASFVDLVRSDRRTWLIPLLLLSSDTRSLDRSRPWDVTGPKTVSLLKPFGLDDLDDAVCAALETTRQDAQGRLFRIAALPADWTISTDLIVEDLAGVRYILTAHEPEISPLSASDLSAIGGFYEPSSDAGWRTIPTLREALFEDGALRHD